MSQTLTQEFDALAKYGALKADIPEDITGNLAPKIELRPYQRTALERWLFYIDKYEARPKAPHLLFHMATGSGKTVLMAALILDLYRRGYRNFLFFVNSAQIIEKTKENFLNPASAKHLFAPTARIDEKPVDIREVDTFDAVNMDTINIHFTTIQGLHRRMTEPKGKLRHHRRLPGLQGGDDLGRSAPPERRDQEQGQADQGRSEGKGQLGGCRSEKFRQHPENMLLEFTATVDLSNDAIRAKYADKILYDYSLRQFREDGYSRTSSCDRPICRPRPV